MSEAPNMAAPRLILNDDGCNFLFCWDDVGVDDLRAYLGRLQGTHVDMVAYCVTFGGGITYYPSDFAELIGSGFAVTDNVKYARWARNLQRFRDEGTEYMAAVFAILREIGIAPVASFRMNDAHMSGDPFGPCAGRFWQAHPEWRLGEPYGYYASCLNYAVPEVREHLRLLVREVVQKYPDIDGIELDGMRSPYFFPDGEGESCAPLMTQLLREIRSDLDEARGPGHPGPARRVGPGHPGPARRVGPGHPGPARRVGPGHPGPARQEGPVQDVPAHAGYELRVNVPRSPELALESGMDVAAWDAEGLVDGIAPGCYNTDFQVPIARWKELLSRTQVHGYVNCSAQTGQYLSREEYRAAAAQSWNAGGDGVYLFNFPCLDELCFTQPVPVDRPPFPAPEFGPYAWHADQQQTRTVLHELGDPEGLRHADKRLLFCMEPPNYRHQVQERADIARPAETQAMALDFDCHEDFAAAREITLELKLVSVSIRDQFAFAINGHPVLAEQTQRLHSAGGRDPRVHSVVLTAYSQYTLRLDPAWLQQGTNTLQVTLTERDPAILGTIGLREVKLSVGY